MRGWSWSAARRTGAVLAVATLALAGCSDSNNDSNSDSKSAANVPSGAQFCKDMKIVFFPGGTEGGGFETVVYNGAKAAVNNLARTWAAGG